MECQLVSKAKTRSSYTQLQLINYICKNGGSIKLFLSISHQLRNLCLLTMLLQELYHELHALDRFEQDFRRKFREEESVPAARRGTVRLMPFWNSTGRCQSACFRLFSH
jgi:hypothetical protein